MRPASCGPCAFYTVDSNGGHCVSVPGCGRVTRRDFPNEHSGGSVAAPPPPPPPPSDDEKTPGGGYTCAQQKEWGKCGEPWMAAGGYCQKTCAGAQAAAGGGCTDVVPPGTSFTCQQQKDWGKCGESWMAGFCAATCGRCGGGRRLAGSSGVAAYGAILAGSRNAKKVKGDDVDADTEETAVDDAPTDTASVVEGVFDVGSRRRLAGSSGVAAYGAILAGSRNAKKVRTDDHVAAVVADDGA